MSVRERDIKIDLGTAIISADRTAKAQPMALRIIGGLLWLFSLCGNVLGFGGGLDGIVRFDQGLAVAVVVAVVYQAVCSGLQVIFCRDWAHPMYIIALLASFVPSFIGYQPLIATPLGAALAGKDGDAIATGAIATAFVGIILLLADIIPERIFVKH